MGPIGPNQTKCTAKFARTDLFFGTLNKCTQWLKKSTYTIIAGFSDSCDETEAGTGVEITQVDAIEDHAEHAHTVENGKTWDKGNPNLFFVSHAIVDGKPTLPQGKKKQTLSKKQSLNSLSMHKSKDCLFCVIQCNDHDDGFNFQHSMI